MAKSVDSSQKIPRVAFVRFKPPDNELITVPISEVAWVLGPKPPLGIRTKVAFNPKHLQDFNSKCMYRMKTGYRSSDGLDHVYNCQIGLLGESEEAIKEELAMRLENRDRLKWSVWPVDLSDAESSGAENGASSATCAEMAKSQRNLTKQISSNQRTAINRSLENVLRQNKLLPNVSDNSQFTQRQSIPSSLIGCNVSKRPYEELLPEDESLIENPYAEIARLRKELAISNSTVQSLKADGASQLTSNQELVEMVRDLIGTELDKRLLPIQRTMTDIKDSGSCGRKMKRDYVQSWVDSLL